MSAKVEQIELQKEFPLLTSNKDFTVWEGYLSADNPQLKIKIWAPNYPKLTDFNFACSSLLKTCLMPHLKTLQSCETLKGLLYSIVHIVKTKLSTAKTEDGWDSRTIKSVHSVLVEIEETIGKENILMINDSFRDFTVKYNDSEGNDHSLRFLIPPDYPRGYITVLEADLPVEVLQSMAKIGSMKSLYEAFQQNVEALLPFWSLCRNLEEKAWVVDPAKPHKKDVYRRIMFNEKLTVMITLNPLKVTTCPEVKFLGSMKAVAEARSKYIKNLERIGWNDDLDIADNIAQLLEVHSLPQKTDLPNESVLNENECYICFTYMTDDEEPPSKWCSNNNCASWYHYSCLLQWLETIVSSVRMYDHIAGPCPYCEEKTWVPLRATNN